MKLTPRPKTIFQEPRPRPDLKDCEIYHCIDLPGESLSGQWDLRPVFREYTGNVDFTGKTVLDIGSATGFLSFMSEQAGADSVVSVDSPIPPVMIPWVENKNANKEQESVHFHERMINGYWYCWHALKSKSRVVYQDVNGLDGRLGQYDVVLAGCILLHLQNPLGALSKIASHAKDLLVITDMEPTEKVNPVLLPNILATGNRDPNDLFSWWQIPPAAVTRMLSVIGFETLQVLHFMIHNPALNQDSNFYSLVARSTQHE